MNAPLSPSQADSFNNAHSVGSWVWVRSPGRGTGSVYKKTLGRAYVSHGVSVVRVEQLGPVALHRIEVGT